MRKIVSIVLNTGLPFLFYYGFIYKNTSALNISKFVIISTFVLGLIVYFAWVVAEEKVTAALLKTKHDRSKFVLGYALTADLIGVLILAASGAFWYASYWLIQSMIEQSIWGKIMEKEK